MFFIAVRNQPPKGGIGGGASSPSAYMLLSVETSQCTNGT
jgi:hypothetical protein